LLSTLLPLARIMPADSLESGLVLCSWCFRLTFVSGSLLTAQPQATAPKHASTHACGVIAPAETAYLIFEIPLQQLSVSWLLQELLRGDLTH